LDPKKIFACTFNDITPKGHRAAFDKPRQVDQIWLCTEARRVLDRIVGTDFSDSCGQVRRGLSAGRVQTVALRLIVERDWQSGALCHRNTGPFTRCWMPGSRRFEPSCSTKGGGNEVKTRKPRTKFLPPSAKPSGRLESVRAEEKKRKPRRRRYNFQNCKQLPTIVSLHGEAHDVSRSKNL